MLASSPSRARRRVRAELQVAGVARAAAAAGKIDASAAGEERRRGPAQLCSDSELGRVPRNERESGTG